MVTLTSSIKTNKEEASVRHVLVYLKSFISLNNRDWSSL